MEKYQMTKDEKAVKVQMLFLGRCYFCSYGGFSKEEFIKKMDEEFQYLVFKPYSGKVLGTASLTEPSIDLYAERGKSLNPFVFAKNINFYRSTALHEMIHKFLIKRDENGVIISTGLHKLVHRDMEFKNYLKDSIVYNLTKGINFLSSFLLPSHYTSNDFGFGASEGYTEWFRVHVLKDNEDVSYPNLTNAFNCIQEQLEKRNEDAVSVMKQFSEGNYEFIFNKLNVSKEVGILFIKFLDFLFAKDYENHLIKKYFENKELLENACDSQDKTKQQEFIDAQNFCSEIEKKYCAFKNASVSTDEIQNELENRVCQNKARNEKLSTLIQNVVASASMKIEHEKNKLSLVEIIPMQEDVTSIFEDSSFSSNMDLLFDQLGSKDISYSDAIQTANLPIMANERLVFKGKRKFKKLCDSLEKAITTCGYLALHLVSICGVITLYVIVIYGILKWLVKMDVIDFEIRKEPISIEQDIEKEDLDPEIDSEFPSDDFSDEESYESLENENGFASISLSAGQTVYQNFYDDNSFSLQYDYENLYYDLVRVSKEGQIIAEGTLKNIDKLYDWAELTDSKIRLRVWVKNEDGSLIYIAWVDVNELFIKQEVENTTKLVLKKDVFK